MPIEAVKNTLFKLVDGQRSFACKLFQEPQAERRAHMEGAAYTALSARGAPVPAPVIVDSSSRALVRDWVEGPTLATVLRHGCALPSWTSIDTAWRVLIATLEAWLGAPEDGRIKRVHCLRRSEILAIAEAVAVSDALRSQLPTWESRSTLIKLAEHVSHANIRLVPLDLNPGNIVLSAEGPRFIDLDGFGLDFEEWSLCKATMLPCGPDSQPNHRYALIAEHPTHTGTGMGHQSNSDRLSRIHAGCLLLALVDATGLWRSGSTDPICLDLVRHLAPTVPAARDLAAALD
jgi:tRNA A-37 threonylcarbamoyl transferase component Bud32